MGKSPDTDHREGNRAVSFSKLLRVSGIQRDVATRCVLGHKVHWVFLAVRGTARMPDGVVHVCDIGGVPKAILRDQDEVVKQLIKICKTAGLTVLNDVSHKFRTGGKGFTSVLLLVESHLAIHTWPEDEYLALTLDTCWGQTITTDVIEAVLELLPHESATVETVPRTRSP